MTFNTSIIISILIFNKKRSCR